MEKIIYSPDCCCLLAEILGRLPSNKMVFQCKCVSKSWLRVISEKKFVGRYLCVRRDRQTPIPSTLVIFPHYEKEGVTTSDHPVFKELNRRKKKINMNKKHPSNLSLRFIPFIRGTDEQVLVVGTCNDLVCCCTDVNNPCDYFICNPYTKQWVDLLPMNTAHEDSCRFKQCAMGFICDPYYNDQQQICSGGTSSESDRIIQVNKEYRWAVVRLALNSKGCSIHVDILSSESPGEWKESDIPRPPEFESFEKDWDSSAALGVAHNGRLYWLGCDGYTFELDPFSSTNIGIAKYRFIVEPEPLRGIWGRYLGVSQAKGCLQLCRLVSSCFNDDHNDTDFLRVWDLKVEEVVVQGEWRWRWAIHRVALQPSEDVANLINGHEGLKMVAFHPNNDDVIYLYSAVRDIIKCNFRGGKVLEIDQEIEHDSCSWRMLYAYVLPWSPTPLPSVPTFTSEELRDHVLGGKRIVFWRA